MAYALRVRCEYVWVGDGVGGVLLGQAQANEPAFGATSGGPYGPVGNAQTLQDGVIEQVPGGDSPSGANFTTALSNAATDLAARLTAAGGPLATIQAWSTGGP